MKRVSYLSIVGLLAGGLALGTACRSDAPTSNSAAIDPRSVDTDREPIKPTEPPAEFPVGIVVPVGTIGYRVDSFSYQNSLSDGAKPAAGTKFLVIKFRSVNTTAREANYANFKVVAGAKEYSLSDKTAKVPDSLNTVNKLAANEVKNGVLIFELPETSGAKLKLVAAPPVKEEKFITLAAPKAATPTKVATPAK